MQASQKQPLQPEQSNNIDKEEVVALPPSSIKASATPELLQELQTKEANYRIQLQLRKPPEATPAALKKSSEVPSAGHSEPDRVKQSTHRFSSPPQGDKGNTWDRIRALASQFSASTVESVSPKAIITRSNQRLRVDDGVTAPLR